MQIAAKREVCIGAGQCVFAAPDTFDQDDDGTVILLQREVVSETEASRVREAVNVCPSRALSIAALDPATT